MNNIDAEKETAYVVHEEPVLAEVNDVPVLSIPSEEGYFPTAEKVDAPLASCAAELFQMHPKYGRTRLLGSGTLTLCDPVSGTPEEVALVGECDGMSFYMMSSDATTKVANGEFLLLLPSDCIGVKLNIEETDPETIVRMEAFLAARTLFHDDSEGAAKSLAAIKRTSENEDLVPKDRVSQSMYRMSLWTAAMIIRTSQASVNQIESFGKARRDEVTEGPVREPSKMAVTVANHVRNVSETTSDVATRISDKIADVLGGTVGRHFAAKEQDSSPKRRARSLVLASTIAYSEVADAIGEAYITMALAAKGESTAFVEKKYGAKAAELVRHTTGASIKIGQAALTMRRVINVKKVARSSATRAIKEGFRQPNK